MIDVRDIPGLIMVGNPSPLLASGNVRLCTPFHELDKAIGSGRLSLEACIRAFDEALGHSWSVLGLLSPVCYRWLRDGDRADRFLEAMTAYWWEIDAIGPRYADALPLGQRLWELPLLLKVVLADRGVSRSQLMEPLPPGGIAALLPPKN